MRLVFPSAFVAGIAFAARTKAGTAEENSSTTKWSALGDVRDVQAVLAGAGSECLPVTESANSKTIARKMKMPDVGVLARCHPSRQACVPDGSSSLGGRCQEKINGETHQQQQQQQQQQQKARLLQRTEEEFVCPATCPEESFCPCAASSYYGFPDAQDCAPEVNAVCEAGAVPDCFNAEYVYFYSYVYCSFAECWLGGNAYDTCVCGYYRDYCDLYGAYAGGYPEIADKCAVSECCAGANTTEESRACVPETPAPESASPTAPPTDSPASPPSGSPAAKPSDSPTDPPADPPSPSPTENPTKQPQPTGPPPVAPQPIAPASGSPAESPEKQATGSPSVGAAQAIALAPAEATTANEGPADADPPPKALAAPTPSDGSGASPRVAGAALALVLAGAGGGFLLFA